MSTNKGDGSSGQPALQQSRHEQMMSDYKGFLNKASITALVAAPLLIAMPPRKLDFYTFSLCGAWTLSASYQNLPARAAAPFGFGPLRKEKVSQEQGRLVAEAREQTRLLEQQVPALASQRKHRSPVPENSNETSAGDPEGWKEQRIREEREKLAQGQDYTSIIVDQIWEVWNWGDKSTKTSKANEVGDKKG